MQVQGLARRPGPSRQHYDIAVIGGGIYGAAIAWEAASRGLGVVLVEREDFGSGTSANSLKTIHGGLRSLQRLDFAEMREYIRERRALLRIAPHLVTPLTCAIPTGSVAGKGRLLMGAGLKLYDLAGLDRNRGLAGPQRIPPAHLVSRQQLAALSPAFALSGVTGAACWTDAQAGNPERLVLAFILSAARAGADVFNYMEKSAFIVKRNAVRGLHVHDRLGGRDLELAADAVIDCSGPWAVQDPLFPAAGNGEQAASMAQAINLVLNRRLSGCALGARPATGLDSDRLLFIAPWRQGSLVGTWYYPGDGDPGGLELEDATLDACLRQVNSLFPDAGISRDDVTLVHQGLQPATAGAAAEPVPLRHTRVIDSGQQGGPSGLYWVQGMKLTTARATAETVVTTLARQRGRPVTASKTCEMPLYGACTDFEQYRIGARQRLAGRWPGTTVSRLLSEYGCHVDALAGLCEQDPSLAEPLPGAPHAIRAELKYALENEMTCTLSDLLLRRTGLGTLVCPARETLEYCADVMAEYHDWDTARRRMNIEKLLEHYPAWHRH